MPGHLILAPRISDIRRDNKASLRSLNRRHTASPSPQFWRYRSASKPVTSKKISKNLVESKKVVNLSNTVTKSNGDRKWESQIAN